MTARDPLTGTTDDELARLAEDAYERRDDARAWEEGPVDVSPDARSVVSVRFNKGELGPIERAAAEAGLPVSTYIRNAALNAATAVDLDGARRALDALLKDAERVSRHLGLSKPKPPTRRRRTSGREVA